MEKDDNDRFGDLEEMIKKLIVQSIERELSNTPNEYNFKIIIVGGVDPFVENLNRVGFAHDKEEPVIEMYASNEDVKVLTELPGTMSSDLELKVQDNTLFINIEGRAQQKGLTVQLPPIDEDSLSYTIYNGVLEVTFNKKS